MNIFGIRFVIAFFVWGLTSSVDPPCKVEISSPSPIIIQTLGLKKIQVKKKLNVLPIYSGESVSTYCANGFNIYTSQANSYNNYKNDLMASNNAIDWTCESDILEANDEKINNHILNSNTRYGEVRVSCQSDNELAVYESYNSLEDCEKGTYVVGAKLLKNKINMAVCYDIEQLQIRFISYVAQAANTGIIEKKYGINELDFMSLDKKLPNLTTYLNFITPGDFDQLSMQKERENAWFNRNWFILKNIVHDYVQPASGVAAFGHALDIVWFSNLWHGSWRSFIKTLHKRSRDVMYNVRLGISGNIELPASIIDFCGKQNKMEPIEFAKDESSLRVPKYVWAHLKALQFPTNVIDKLAESEEITDEVPVEEFVAIGFNSPFELQSSDEKKLCKDMCSTISWINEEWFDKIRLLPANGLMICCRIEDVVDKLESFPYTKGMTYNFTLSYADTKQPPRKYTAKTFQYMKHL